MELPCELLGNQFKWGYLILRATQFYRCIFPPLNTWQLHVQHSVPTYATKLPHLYISKWFHHGSICTSLHNKHLKTVRDIQIKHWVTRILLWIKQGLYLGRQWWSQQGQGPTLKPLRCRVDTGVAAVPEALASGRSSRRQWAPAARPSPPAATTFRRTSCEKEGRRDKKKNAWNSTKSKGIAPKLCTGDLHGVGKISQKSHVSIRTQTPGISDHVQECSFCPQNEIGSILRARVDSIKFTHGVASTHVFARIKPTESSPNAYI